MSDLAGRRRTRGDAQRRLQLTAKLQLAESDLEVAEVSVRGQGTTAEVEIRLSNGWVLQADRFGDLWSHIGLAKWVTQSTGINASAMTKNDAAEANALIRQLAGAADRETTAGDLGAEHGVDFLRRAHRMAFDVTEQASRVAAFSHLDQMDPVTASDPRLPRPHKWGDDPPPLPASVADASVVLVHTTGELYVRCDWLLAHVRRRGEVSSPNELVRRMTNAGWTRPGKRGRIKATPTMGGPIVLSMWIVPPGWEAEQSEEGGGG